MLFIPSPCLLSGPYRTARGKYLHIPEPVSPAERTGNMSDFNSSAVSVVATSGYSSVLMIVVIIARHTLYWLRLLARMCVLHAFALLFITPS